MYWEILDVYDAKESDSFWTIENFENFEDNEFEIIHDFIISTTETDGDVMCFTFPIKYKNKVFSIAGFKRYSFSTSNPIEILDYLDGNGFISPREQLEIEELKQKLIELISCNNEEEQEDLYDYCYDLYLTYEREVIGLEMDNITKDDIEELVNMIKNYQIS